ncbi:MULTISPECIES: S8 family peptidase [Arthrobacter]|uniref:S8 family peptidase n=2 Tax=Arthrobacter TaxID=1663 RepID=A0ABU9KMR4_9MICC|nr:S8 family peptidase [Arthrobacter sp. YJM1]MDP5226934.1 S8 family peptidase [Arthrobacter sp. YJM1]
MGNTDHRRRHRRSFAVAALAALGLGAAGLVPAAEAHGRPSGAEAAASVSAVAAGRGQETVSGIIVTYKENSSHGDAVAHAWGVVARMLGVSPREVRHLAVGSTLVSLGREVSAQEADTAVAALLASGAVESAEPDARMWPELSPDDPRYAEQWDFTGANGMRIPGAWDVATGSGAVVAVLDTGITRHPDLDANILSGYDFISDPATARDGGGRDSDPQDEGDWYAAGECGKTTAKNSSWHGTHVTGTVAAVTGNAVGVAGVAPGAKVVPVRVLGKCGGATSDIADAIVWASGGTVAGVPVNPYPAQVINMSLGGTGTCSATYQNAINAAVARGVTVVVSAGNSAADASGSRPANCQNVVAVAAGDKDGKLASYSNYGTTVDVTAPGGDTSKSGGGILSTLNAGTTVPGAPSYAWYQGTSMAAPHISGLAAMMKSLKPGLTPTDVESLLKQGARPMPGGCSLGCGAGLSDAAATMSLTAAR